MRSAWGGRVIPSTWSEECAWGLAGAGECQCRPCDNTLAAAVSSRTPTQLDSVSSCSASQGKRVVLQNTRIMLHHPSGVARGQASDINREAQELLKTRDYMNAVLAEATGQDFNTVRESVGPSTACLRGGRSLPPGGRTGPGASNMRCSVHVPHYKHRAPASAGGPRLCAEQVL